MATQTTSNPIEQLLPIILQAFTKTAEEIRRLDEQQRQYAKAAYHGMTGSGKARYVSELVAIERENGSKGAQSRVADLLGVTGGRISQLVTSDLNRKNGK
jgi:hypothetical protein